MTSSSNGAPIMDWQSGIGTIQDGISHLWETGEHSDVEFMVGKELWDDKSKKWIPVEEPKLFKAHKLVLLTRSSVFATQFGFNNGHQDNGMPIKVNDITTSAFKAMLAFLYKNDLSLINSDNLLEVYSAARKYLLQVLAEKCHRLASNMLNWKNSVDIWRMAKLHEDKALIGHCLQFFDFNIRHVDVKNDDVSFWSLNREELGELLKRDTLRIYQEKDLFYYLQFWAVKQCKNAGIEEPTGQEKRAKIGHLINEIRFPRIKHTDFTKIIIPTGILTAEEISTMLIYYCEDADPLPFSTKSRAILLYQGYNKLVDKAMVEREKSVLRGEIRRLKIEKTEIEEKFKQMEKKSKEMEETIQRLEKNVSKSNTNLQAGGKRKKVM